MLIRISFILSKHNNCTIYNLSLRALCATVYSAVQRGVRIAYDVMPDVSLLDHC